MSESQHTYSHALWSKLARDLDTFKRQEKQYKEVVKFIKDLGPQERATAQFNQEDYVASKRKIDFYATVEASLKSKQLDLFYENEYRIVFLQFVYGLLLDRDPDKAFISDIPYVLRRVVNELEKDTAFQELSYPFKYFLEQDSLALFVPDEKEDQQLQQELLHDYAQLQNARFLRHIKEIVSKLEEKYKVFLS